METQSASSFWWLKPPNDDQTNANVPLTAPKLELEISSSLADFLEKEQSILNANADDSRVDIGSIIDEINRVAAQSPLGPYEPAHPGRSVADIMKEAERVYAESSHSFEQLSSQRSKTSHNITEIGTQSAGSTPTPKSVSPLPNDDDSDTYSEDFSVESKIASNHSMNEQVNEQSGRESRQKDEEQGVELQMDGKIQVESIPLLDLGPESEENVIDYNISSGKSEMENNNEKSEALKVYEEKIGIQGEIIKALKDDNQSLREDIMTIKNELQQTCLLLSQTKASLAAKSLTSPEIGQKLTETLEQLKDTKETNTSLQMQLNTINKSHALLKNSYDDLTDSNRTLERRLTELDTILLRYKNELQTIQFAKERGDANETNLMQQLEIEKEQNKKVKQQNEKDAKCILDLNRQIKEMERIITRKHPDSVSALIVAAKNDASSHNLTARKVLEDRIKSLEDEATSRDSQSSRIFFDIQEKFNLMKLKYESHIEDLELHVNDLKDQLKRKIDTFDVYTQTSEKIIDAKVPEKDSVTISTQTNEIGFKSSNSSLNSNNVGKKHELKEDAHLLATIRGLQADLSNKEKVLMKIGRELDELRKTNRKLQKEREGSLKSLNKEFRSYPEKLSAQAQINKSDDDLKSVRSERDKMRQQLCRLEKDYQNLKEKRLHDLNALQVAHEMELAQCVSHSTPLRDQLELQQATLATLQSQLCAAKEELLIVTVERDHLNSKKNSFHDVEPLQKRIEFLEKRYEEREFRLRAIVHDLAQKSQTNRACEQCAERQKQLIGYKVELDQLLATLRALK